MKRILFVDDEPRILQGLERMLRGKRHEWEMRFAPGGKEALEEFRLSPFDVIVSDMRMPEMDGAMLLKKVQKLYPHMVRIVLSGHAEMESALRVVSVAHQFMSKPCSADQLIGVIERAFHLQALLEDGEIKRGIGKIEHLPVLPGVYQSLSKALCRPDTTVGDITAIVEQDMAISARILQLVNSAFFSLSRRVTNVSSAISLLGLNMIKNLTLTVEVFRSFQRNPKSQEFSSENLQQHSLWTARIARRMFQDNQKSDDAFMAGMLHDIGKLIMMSFFPKQFAQVLKDAREQDKEWHFVEKEHYGVTHAEIGAYLLGIWGLPYPIIEAVAFHHEPRSVPHQEFGILSAVYVANRLASHSADSSEDGIDREYLQALGVADQLPSWKELAIAERECGEEANLG